MSAGDAGRRQRTESLTGDFRYTLDIEQSLLRRQSAHQDIEVVQTASFGKVLILDGSFQCSELDEGAYHEPLVHSALLAVPRPRRVLIVGGGDGGAAEEALKCPSVEELEHVELDRAVIDAARQHLGAVNGGLWDRPDARYSLVIGDGGEAIRRARGMDVIVLDLTDPAGPSAPLYDAENFAACRAALQLGGALSLHLGSPWLQRPKVQDLLSMLQAEFAVVTALAANVPMSAGPWLMAVCTMEPPLWLADPAVAQQRLADFDRSRPIWLDVAKLRAMHELVPPLQD